MPVPLIHIGYPKAASTWLQQSLFNDERTGFYAPWGLPSYESIEQFIIANAFRFSAKKVRQMFDLGLQDAAKRNLIPVISEEFLIGHQVEGKYWGKDVADRLNATFPEAKILMVIREQKSEILSSYRQSIRRGDAASLSRFIGIGETRKPGIGAICQLDYFEYDLAIAYYHQLFGADNVLVLPFETLVKDPQAASQTIIDFAGAKGELTSHPIPKNVGFKAGTLMFRQQINGFCVPPETPKSPRSFPWRVGYKLSELVDRFLPQKYHNRAETYFRNTIAKAVGNSFRESNQRTSKLISINLAELGYDC
ncbi:MAG TPA: sulfotransferase [Oscillatoriales cyanobacterium M59_W2019_021]|nr:sulfotransferase [Oscillatoriales cyanobacterium M59_W2019_021]